ncbi:MAG: EamA family transporter, partial [Betaproteobacteria bacterium]
WPWIVLLAIVGLTAHYCITRAFRLADATVVVPIDFVRLPLIAIVGWLFYGEHVQIWVYVGALFVFAATWLNITGGKSVAAVESTA